MAWATLYLGGIERAGEYDQVQNLVLDLSDNIKVFEALGHVSKIPETPAERLISSFSPDTSLPF